MALRKTTVPRITMICEHCKKEVAMRQSDLSRKKGNQFFCSRECRIAAHAIGRPPVERVVKQCANCGKDKEMRKTDFERRVSGRVFCSSMCAKKMGTKMATIEKRPCETCKTIFKPDSRNNPGRFCSKDCFDVWQRRDRIEQVCEYCLEIFWSKPSEVIYNSERFCSTKCAGLGRIVRPLDRIYNDKPARLDEHGYVWVWQPDHPESIKYKGWIAEHRLVAEKMIGRVLTSDDEVNHINRDRQNNDPSNLEVLANKDHAAVTARQRLTDKEMLQLMIAEHGFPSPEKIKNFNPKDIEYLIE